MRPQLPRETEVGIEFLRGLVERNRVLKLEEPRRADVSSSVLLGISASGKTYELCLSPESLADLPGTKEYRVDAQALIVGLEKRINNVDPNLFTTRGGRSIRIRPEWPFQPWYNEQYQLTAASAVFVELTDVAKKETALCRFRVTSQDMMVGFGPAFSPFNRYELMTNTIRRAVDSDAIKFSSSRQEHPGNVIDFETAVKTIPEDEDGVRRFLKGKVWQLGFQRGGRDTLAWVGDPWDANYLGCSKEELLQQAAILDAQSEIVLSESGEFGSVGRNLLAVGGPAQPAEIRTVSSIRQFETAFSIYTIGESLGEGGAGKVVKASNEEGLLVAIKYLKPDVMSTQKKGRFKNEMAFSLRNSHPNVIRVLDCGLTEIEGVTVPFYVMPIYRQTLRKVMKRGAEITLLLDIYEQVLQGVSSAHDQGIWHRDLKPENILYEPESGNAVVSDFGIAHFGEELLQAAVKTQPRERLANFGYAAPEQVSGGEVDHRADIYALGLILYEMMTGDLLRGTGHSPVARISSSLADLDPLIDKMTRQSAADRHRRLNDVQEEFRAFRQTLATGSSSEDSRTP